MYNLEPEKPLCLAKFYGIGGIFNLAILLLFTGPLSFDVFVGGTYFHIALKKILTGNILQYKPE